MKSKFLILRTFVFTVLLFAGFQLRSQTFTNLNVGYKTVDFLGVSAPTDVICYVSGTSGTILKTSDGGGTWVQQKTGGSALYSICFTSTLIGYAVGDFGAAFKTTDGGGHWNPMTVSSTTDINLRSIKFAPNTVNNGNIGYATGGDQNGFRAVIYRTIDGGTTWKVIRDLKNSTGGAGFYSTSIVNPTGGTTWQKLGIIAVKRDGEIHTSSDGGDNWSINTGVSQCSSESYFTSLTTGFLGTTTGEIYKTTNTGQAWKLVTSPKTSAILRGVDFCDGTTNGYFVGGDINNNTGTIVNTKDGGKTWVVLPLPANTPRLYGVDFFNCCNGYVVGLDGTILKLGTAITNLPPTVCLGDFADLTADGGSSSYKWSPATYLNKTTGVTVRATPTATTTYIVTGTSASGCVSKISFKLTVSPKPTVTVSAASAAICNGKSTILTAAGAQSYSWSPATGLDQTTGKSVTAHPTVTTIYTVTGTNASGCFSTAKVTVTVNPLPTVTVSPNIAICSGTSTKLTAAGASTYAWSPGTNLSAITGAVVTAKPAATITYMVTGIDTKGCQNTASVTVTVSKVTVSANTEICEGGTSNLTAAGASTYKWSPAIGLDFTVGATVKASPAVTTKYTVTGTNAQGCIDKADVTVTVDPKPIVTVTPNLAICDGSSAQLTAAGADRYEWSPPENIDRPVEATVTANPTATTTYIVTGRDLNGCVNTANVTVTVNPKPILRLGTTAKTICNKTLVDIALDADPSVPCNLTWKANTNPNILVQSTTPNNNPINDVLNNIGTNFEKLIYTVTATSINGACKGADADITVTVVPDLTISTTNLIICTSEPIPQLIVNSPSNISSKFTWKATSNLQVDGETNSTTSAANITDILTNSTLQNQVVNYMVTPISVLKSCKGTPQAVNVTVRPQPVIDLASTKLTICSSEPIPQLITNINSKFTWTAQSNSEVGGETNSAASATYITDILTNFTKQTQVVSYMVTPISVSKSCYGTPQAVNVTVNPQPVVFLYPESYSKTVCDGTGLGFPLMATVPSTFSWYSEDNPYVTGEITTPQSADYVITNLTLENSPDLKQTITYSITAVSNSGGCKSEPEFSHITLAPRSIVDDISVNVCTGSTLDIALTANLPSNYTWKAWFDNADVVGESLSLVTSNTITDHLTNLTTNNQGVMYLVKGRTIEYGCEGSEKQVYVLVSSDPCGKALSESEEQTDDKAMEQTDETTISVAPNPFQGNTTITYRLNKPSVVNLEVMDVLGQKLETIVNTSQTEGEYKYGFNAKENASGIYYVKITIDGAVTVKKIVGLN